MNPKNFPCLRDSKICAGLPPEIFRQVLVELVVDEAPMALALLEESGEVILDNREYRKLSAELAVPKPAHLVLDMARPDWRVSLLGAGASGEFHAQELRIDQPGGAARCFSCSAIPLVTEDDGCVKSTACHYLLLVISDISALRQEQERARLTALRALLAEEEHTEVLRESLSAALYRLEGPLNVMRSAIGMLKSREPAMSGALSAALAEGRAHLEELRQLIPLDTHEAFAPVNLNAVLRDVLDVCTARMLSNGITVNWRPATALPAILGRPLQLHSLFKALVDNAIDALSQRGWKTREISLTTRLKQDCAEIIIDDRGPGVPVGLRLKAFEPFFTTRGNQKQHLGTGLSRALQAAIEHGGTLALRDAPGGGCRALVELPLENKIAVQNDARGDKE
ncbi:MAG: nitrogen fixation negative regulator NifL [Zoogloeaceae bacterium]|jgi:nitrogen fixation negative regulator NifL|nr:nitrogen fixation negative regulator NifL [Zoogloeaceae bacterium]